MEKLIFFETEKKVWFCPSRDWERYKYENNITPIRQALVLATNEWIAEILKTYNNNIDVFVEVIKEELDNNFYTTNSN